MAHIKKENIYNANVKINRIADLIDFKTNSIIRVTIRTRAEAEELIREGVAVYEKIIETPNDRRYVHHYCEVKLSDLAKIALK